MSKKVKVEFRRKKLTVPNLEKVLYPEVAFTRG